MKLVKSLLLGSAAGFAAVAGAQAADLPVRAAAPAAAAVDYVKVCSTYGAGFFTIPGGETCLKVAGRARADIIYIEPFTRADNAIEFLARGRVQLDARTATSYGLLRAFVRLEITRRAAATTANVAQAFVQFGGLTAGRVTSFFSNPDLPTFHYGTLRFDDSPDINLLAYTFQFGGGLSASISLEDGLERRNAAFGAAAGGGGSGQVFVDPAGNVVFQNPFALVYGGQTVPDIVGNIKATGTWGSAQLSGALHQVRDVGVAGGRFNAFNGQQLRAFADTEYGWAVMGTVGFNLPALGQGDAVWLAATYSSGAASYSGFSGTTGFGGGLGPDRTGFQFQTGVVDAVVNPFNGDLDLTDIWTVAGGFNHFWSPQFSTGIMGSFAHVDFGGNRFVAGNGIAVAGGGPVLAGGNLGLNDFNEWRVGVNTKWLPVSGLQLGLEVLYAETDFRGRVAQQGGILNQGQRTLIGDIGAFEGRFRVQRDF